MNPYYLAIAKRANYQGCSPTAYKIRRKLTKPSRFKRNTSIVNLPVGVSPTITV